MFEMTRTSPVSVTVTECAVICTFKWFLLEAKAFILTLYFCFFAVGVLHSTVLGKGTHSDRTGKNMTLLISGVQSFFQLNLESDCALTIFGNISYLCR